MIKRIAIAGLLIASPASAQYIDGLPPATSVTSTDLLPLCQSGTSGRPGTCKPHSATVGSLGSAVSITANGVTQSGAQWMAAVSTAPGIDARSPAFAGGVKCDGTTDDTAALQAAISAAQSATYEGVAAKLLLPPGRCMTTPLTISGQVAIEGSLSSGTVLVLETGATSPAVTIQTAGSSFPAGAPGGVIALRNLRIENQVIKTGSSSAHGILIAAGTWFPGVTLDHVTIYGMPGDGLKTTTAQDWVDCTGCEIINNLGNGVSAANANDWHFRGGNIGTNGQSGVVLSGSTQFSFEGTNIFSNGTYNVWLYSGSGAYPGNHVFTDVMFDRGVQTGVRYDLQGLTGAKFVHCTFVAASQGTPNTYPDVEITSYANSLAVFSDSFWGNNYANDASYTEKYALNFDGSSNTAIVNAGNTFDGGTLRTNAAGQVLLGNFGSANIATVSGMALKATQQYTGMVLSNASNVVGAIKGFGTGNDNGTLQLSNGGTVGVQIGASSNTNFINGTLYLGNGATNAAPVGQWLEATGGSGTNIAGGSLTIAGGPGTGTGVGGDIVFKAAPAGTTGSSPNSAVEQFRVLATGGAKITTGTLQIATSSTPATSSAACSSGQIAWDTSYIYICTATNTWKRSALSAF